MAHSQAAGIYVQLAWANIKFYRYLPNHNYPMDIMESSISAAKPVGQIQPGEEFGVEEELVLPSDHTVLRLADGRGWVSFTHCNSVPNPLWAQLVTNIDRDLM